MTRYCYDCAANVSEPCAAHCLLGDDNMREVYIGPRFAASWVPRGCGAFRAYKGSGWRFLQLWRIRFAVKCAYE